MDFSTLLDKNGKPSSRKLAQLSEDEHAKLVEASSWLTESAGLSERLYSAIHGLRGTPKKCLICEKSVQFGAWGRPYHGMYCGHECMWQAKTLKPKKVKTEKPLLTKEERLERQKATNQARYGVDWSWQTKESKDRRKKKAAEKLACAWIDDLHNGDTVTPLFEATEYEHSRQWMGVQCNKCNTKFEVQRYRWSNKSRTLCPTCFTPNASAGQHEVAEWIKSLGVKVRLNDRKIFKAKREIDIWLPDHNLAIEYDGAFNHSERRRHDIRAVLQNKHELFSKAGLRQVYIFDFEWAEQNEIVKSRLLSLLGRSERKLYARKCRMQQLSPKERSAFFVKTHLQGDVNSSAAYGLFFNDELVAAASFGKSRFSQLAGWELLRFSTSLNTSVVGGASKLLKAWCTDNPEQNLLSFSDDKWGTGEVYKTLGFESCGNTGLSYFYIGPRNQRRSRQQFMKHKLPDLFPNFDASKTEWENCAANKWYRVWELGNTRWVLRRAGE